MRSWLSVILGVVVGVATICLPLLVSQSSAASFVSLSGQERADYGAAEVEGTKKPSAVMAEVSSASAIVGTSVVVAFAAYVLARRQR